MLDALGRTGFTAGGGIRGGEREDSDKVLQQEKHAGTWEKGFFEKELLRHFQKEKGGAPEGGGGKFPQWW